MPQGVRQQVHQHPLDLVGSERGGQGVVHLGRKRDVSQSCLRLDATEAARDDGCDGELSELQRERIRVDPGELEQIVYELGEHAYLLAEGRQVLVGLAESVLERLEHGLHVCEGSPEVVACPGDELPPGVEQPLQVLAHVVERARQLGQLSRPALRGARIEVAPCELHGCLPDTIDGVGDRSRDDECGDDRGERGGCGDREDLDIVAHVEHHPAGEQHRSQREQNRQNGEAGELKPHGREQSERGGEDQTDGEGRERDDDACRDHGTSL